MLSNILILHINLTLRQCHAFALAFIVPQGVTCGKIVAYGQPPESAFCHGEQRNLIGGFVLGFFLRAGNHDFNGRQQGGTGQAKAVARSALGERFEHALGNLAQVDPAAHDRRRHYSFQRRQRICTQKTDKKSFQTCHRQRSSP